MTNVFETDKMEHSYMRSHEIKSEEELNLLHSVDGLVVFEVIHVLYTDITNKWEMCENPPLKNASWHRAVEIVSEMSIVIIKA